MAGSQNLTGSGMPPGLAGRIGHSISALTAAGTAQVGAAVLGTSAAVVTPSAGATAVVLSTNADPLKEYYVFNPTAVAGVVFAPVGGSLNGTLNGSIALPANGFLICVMAQSPAGVPQWFAK